MRTYNQGEKKALKRLYSGVCPSCGSVTDSGHADHITPYSLGGGTDPGNAQFLCSRCNLRYGAKPKQASGAFTVHKPALDRSKLRKWQSEALDQQLNAIAQGIREFFVGAGVGSGKTRQALSLYLAGGFDLVIVVAPKQGIRKSWEDDAQEMGIDLQPVLSGADFVGMRNEQGIYTMPNGFVLTAQMLPSVINDCMLYCAKFRVLVVLDEAHHLGEEMTWTDNAAQAFQGAAFMVALSGTPERADEKRIFCLRYQRQGDMGEGVPHYRYDYEQALSDGHVAPIVTRFVGGEIERHHDDGRLEVYRYTDGDYSDLTGTPDKQRMAERLRLSAVESYDWQLAAINEARKDLMDCREDGTPWAGLVLCKEIAQAEQIQRYIEQRYGDKCLLVVGDTSTEQAVSTMNEDTGYLWCISITKISEGISIDRLRVGVLLTSITTRTYFDQSRGRLVRLHGDKPQLDQAATFYIPADPRIMDYALSSNQMMLHSIPWLSCPPVEAEAAYSDAIDSDERDRMLVSPLSATAESTEQPTLAGSIEELRRRLMLDRREMTLNIGSYRLKARAEMDGAALNDEYMAEDEYLERRERLAGVIDPLTAMRGQGNTIEILEAFLNE